MIISIIFGAIGLIAFIFIAVVLISSSVTNAPYLPSDAESIAIMVSFADIHPGDKAADLGSGDGRIVIAMAKAGAEAHGYEINPILVWLSRWRIKKEGLSGKAFIHGKSFWREDLGQFQIVSIFTLPFFIPRLQKKLAHELKPGSRYIANGSTLKFWQYKKKDEKHGVYLYIKK